MISLRIWATALLVTVGPVTDLSAQWLDSARTRLAQLDGVIQVTGLDSAVEVRRDRWGVPHIYAKTVHDLFFAQGFVAAQDRLWQIDMWRRIGEGRLSEVLGPDHVERDRFARLLKYRGEMEAEWTSYAPDTRAIVTAFVAGLNAYVGIARQKPPVEYAILGFLPEPFANDVPLQRMAALSMTGNATSEIERAVEVVVLGRDRTEQLFPLEPVRRLDPAPGLSLDGIGISSLGATYEAYRNVQYSRLDGSNNWVVSGKLTASGKPLLANDPHRAITNPSLRYLTHLVGPGWNVIGAGEPALPGVAGGHNERIGFGFTIVGMDQQDVYVERMGHCPHASPRRCYLTGSGWRPVKTQVDTIRVKGQPPRVVQLEFTEHGPIVAEDSSGRGFVIKFVGSEPGTAGYLAQISIDRATDWTSFQAAAARWKLPTENLVYADVDGNIGWVGAGLMPVRSWTGMLPVPGDGRFEWQGFLPFEQLPMSFNPASGFIATANHNILPAGYTKPLAYEWAEPSRYQRIAEVLASRKGWTRQDFERLQHDELSIPARELVPLLVAAADRRGLKGPAWDPMRQWDYVMRKESAAPVLFAVWLDSLSSRTFSEVAGGRSDELRRAGVGGLSFPMLMQMVRKQGRDSLLISTFEGAALSVRARFGSDPRRWRWGEIHHARFPHPLARSLDLPEASRGGHWTTVNMTGGSDLRQSSGASFREILDFADWDNSVATSVPGQSGQPGSPFYGNLLPLWERGEYFPLLYSRAAVEKHTAHVLWLKPGTN
jgi:penicillin G amidase